MDQLDEVGHPINENDTVGVENHGEESILPFIKHIYSLPRLDGNLFNVASLQRICQSLIVLYANTDNDVKPVPRLSRRKLRHKEYAGTQNLWRKNRSKCVESILHTTTDNRPAKKVMMPLWETVFTQGVQSEPDIDTNTEVLQDLWRPITLEEIRMARINGKTASEPDGFTAKKLAKIPVEVLARIFNIFLIAGWLPKSLTEAHSYPEEERCRKPWRLQTHHSYLGSH